MANPAFESFGLGAAALAAIARKGFEEPTPIQALTIPRLLKPGPDLIARARTGTGKTAAFGIPFAELLAEPEAKIRALVLVPTRELALQVSGELISLRSGPAPRVAPVYGGASMGEQLRRLRAGVDVVVGTPGRVIDHLDRGTLDLSGLEFLVLDEADEMLDMGFIEDIEKVMEKCAPGRRVVLFSATMPAGIAQVAKRRLGQYETVEDSSEAVATELAEQVWLEVREADKLEALCRVIDVEEDFYGIVFTSTRVEADRIAKALEERGYGAEPLHGEISQEGRERVLAKFRERRVNILVATDVAARGIDIERLTHVVNWSLPHDPEAYVHRVGRTGRAGNAGTALTLVTPEEYRKLFRFKRAAGGGLKKAKVPAVGEVLGARSERIRGRILAMAAAMAAKAQAAAGGAPAGASEPAAAGAGPADGGAPGLWRDMAASLLERLDAPDALAAVLQEAFGAELDPARYREIAEVSVDAAATARLFIGVGKRDRATPRGLASLVKRLSGLPDRLVGGIEIYENFSFATVPFEAAEKVIAEARRSGGLPAVRLATPRGSGLAGPRGEGPPRGAPPGRKPYGPGPRSPRPAGKAPPPRGKRQG
ncbi:MAG TPA: DEAD/DEAH box helicase [Spirochaetales bacterium]|nr:DEAD/DEAH box helicase [Spirochaetales bacterium]HRY53643.1 DEAD/DEAH box helicase [Spirochaetia bacterium]